MTVGLLSKNHCRCFVHLLGDFEIAETDPGGALPNNLLGHGGVPPCCEWMGQGMPSSHLNMPCSTRSSPDNNVVTSI